MSTRCGRLTAIHRERAAALRPLSREEVAPLERLAARVSQLRSLSGLSRAVLARRAGMSVSGLQHIERATRRPRASTLSRIACALTSDSATAGRILTDLIALAEDALADERAPRSRALTHRGSNAMTCRGPESRTEPKAG